MTQHHPVVHDIPTVSTPAVQRGVHFTWSDTFGKAEKPRNHHDFYYQSWNSHAASLQLSLKNMKRGQLFQTLVMLAVTCFVLDSYYKAMTTTEHLLMVKHEESLMMLHLKRLEEQALHLHESVTRLSESGFDRMAAGGTTEGSDSANSLSQHVDADLIKVQYDQLRQMEDELNHEVKSLQNKIRQTDRANIIRAFGEGPVQVVFEIDFAAGASPSGGASRAVAAGSSAISILLWYETPHAAWTLLDQIRRGVWDGAPFDMDRGFAVTANPADPDAKKKRLEFVEKGQKMHEPWTVGLTEADNGELSLFINLQDNSQYHKHDVCIGKIIDGFDTLQRLTRAARNQKQSKVPVTIRRATASHLTRRESAGLI
jgi:cyclophilin family peptidyl-prolyl cis-trans isomerase